MKSYGRFWFKILYFSLTFYFSSALNSLWQWKCINRYCERTSITKESDTTKSLSLPVCRLLCTEYAALWPYPTGEFSAGDERTLEILDAFNITVDGFEDGTPSTYLFNGAVKIFKKEISDLFDNVNTVNGKPLQVHISVENSNIRRLTLNTNENYTLSITTNDGIIETYIAANNFFGARHGLTTLAQLIVLDDLRDELVILNNVYISDGPAYPYRGVLLDTARNYMDLKVIKSILRGMGASKLNTFHWHITDSQSFPFVSKTYPELSKLGAYSSKEVYTYKMIREIVDYAIKRGIRVLPEFDSPAHVGEGWQNTGFVTCLNWQPYTQYCSEAPCGQFDPTQEGLYPMLGGIYGDIIQAFDLDPDIFHIGGDEVNFNCWNNTDNIVEWMQNNGYDLSNDGYMKLWEQYLNKSVAQLYEQVGREIPLIIWESTLTIPGSLNILSPEKYTIQIWVNLSHITNYILSQNYNIIISNFDAMYLDCGFGSFYNFGPSYCSYNTWYMIYNNTPEAFAGARKNQVLGNEVAFWSELGGSSAAETRIWPRAAAVAEVVWSEPAINSWQEALDRFMIHRERLIQHGIRADAMQMQWCTQNEENCSIGSYFYSQPSATP